jgi:hypothetical protein
MFRSSGGRLCSWLFLSGAMYIVVGESKTVPFSGLAKSRHSLATSFLASRVDGASTREASGSCCSSEVIGVGRDAVLVFSLGHAFFALYLWCWWWLSLD